jgi:hypothetical protein
MTNPTIKLHDVETNEVIERDMTKAELNQNKADAESQLTRIAEAEAKAAAKREVLAKLGLTAEEVSALLA